MNKEGDIFACSQSWMEKNVSLTAALETTFNIPVIVENEANAGAYGEKKSLDSDSPLMISFM
ncbi:hypothetical protein GCM10020331_079660 [Ectobacillus funiculus]